MFYRPGKSYSSHDAPEEITKSVHVFVLVCRALNENVPYMVMSLNIWSPVGRPVWKGFGSVASLKEVPRVEVTLRFQRFASPSAPCLSVFCLWFEDVSCQLPAPATTAACLPP